MLLRNTLSFHPNVYDYNGSNNHITFYNGAVDLQFITELIGYTGENSRPIISNRETNTNVRVKDGETLLIGGMIFETEEEKVNKVPLFGDIPLIKSLFRYSSIQKEQRELLIFITPTIISQL